MSLYASTSRPTQENIDLKIQNYFNSTSELIVKQKLGELAIQYASPKMAIISSSARLLGGGQAAEEVEATMGAVAFEVGHLLHRTGPHILQQDGLDNHLHHLCAIIIRKHVTLRLHHKANTETQENIDEKIQNYINRLIATNKHQ